MAGSGIFQQWGNTPSSSGIIEPPKPTPVQQSYNVYNTAVKQQAGDYDSIMQQYKALADKANAGANSPNLSFNPINASQYAYQPTAATNSSISNLGDLASTGGYSEADKNNIRARGISPIRAVYAGAQRDIDRGRVLSGGFSPNYAAVKAKMARELSDTIAGQVTNVNAGLAQSIAQNRLAASPAYASAAGAENALRTGVGQHNSDTVNNVNEFNAEMPLKYGQFNLEKNNAGLGAVNGQASLYGTTPALSALFGNQALSAAQLQNMITQQGNQNNLNATGQILR